MADLHDLVISNSVIIDGTGREPFKSDLAVRNGRIVAIGGNVGPGRHEVDAEGSALMPGIIDTHTHYDAQITWDPLCDPSPALGVTTVVLGNCGFTIAPCKPSFRTRLMRDLSAVEGMSYEALEAGISWGFESFPEYLNMLQDRGVGPNVCAYIGHSALRTYVLGESACSREATDGEILQMAQLLREAMDAGAVGFSTSTHEQHIGDGGTEMASRMASRKELIALVNAMAHDGKGTFMIVKGSGTSIADVEQIAGSTHRPIFVSSLRHNPSSPQGAFNDMARLRDARDRGNRVYGQCSCLPMMIDFTLENPYLFEAFEAWRPAVEAKTRGWADYRDVLADPSFRQQVRATFGNGAEQRIFKGDWAKVTVAEAATEANRTLEGQSVADLARQVGRDPLDFMLDLSMGEDLKTRFVAEVLNSDELAVGRILTDPDSHVSLSDAGAHITFICDAGYGLHLLGHWVRDRGVLSLPEAVRRLTSQGADLLGIADRGRLQVGAAADLLLFDPASVGIGRKSRLYDFPAGATRLRTDALGVRGVWVNGRQVVGENGRFMELEKLPGQVLRNFNA